MCRTESQSATRRVVSVLLLTAFAATPTPLALAEPPRPCTAGVACIWGDATDEEMDVVHVIQGYMRWSQLEPENGHFDWSIMDGKLARAAELHKPIMLQINFPAPTWIFDHVANCAKNGEEPAPQYWDPVYIAYYEDLIEQTGKHLSDHPHKSWILGIRVQKNALGTEHSRFRPEHEKDPAKWRKPAGRSYTVPWSPDVEREYLRRIIRKHVDVFHPLSIRTAYRVGMWTAQVGVEFMNQLFADPLSMVMGTGYRTSRLNQNQEQRFWNVRRYSRERGTLAYVEDYNTASRAMDADTPGQEIYWRQLMKLDAGVTYSATYGSGRGDSRDLGSYRNGKPAWVAGLDFFNKYAGFHNLPSQSPGAWIAFCEFPTRDEDLPPIVNLGFFLTLNDPDKVSQTVQNVGPSGSYQGWHARRLRQTAGLTLDRTFANSIRGNDIFVHITYLVERGVTWRLTIDDKGQSRSLKSPVSGDAGGWRTISFPIRSSAITGGTPHDIAVEVLKGQPAIHMIAITRSAP